MIRIQNEIKIKKKRENSITFIETYEKLRPARKTGGKKRRGPGRGEAARCGSGVAGRWRGPVVYRRGSSCTRSATLAPLRPHNLRRNVTPHRRLGLLGARLCLLMGQMGLLGPLGLLGVPRYMRSRAVVFPVRSAQTALPPRKSPYLTPWSERSGDFRRGLRPSVWLKNPKILRALCSSLFSVWLAPLRFTHPTLFRSTPSGSEYRACSTSGFAPLIPRLSMLRLFQSRGGE